MSIQDGYHLNVAIVTNARAWDFAHNGNHVVTHFCAVYCGRDHADAMRVCAEFAARFPEGNKPGMFQLDLTKWQGRGENVAMPEAPETAAQCAIDDSAIDAMAAEWTKEAARAAAIVPGMLVAFQCYGKPMTGVVERVGAGIVHLQGGRWMHLESVSPAIEGAN